MASFKLLVLYDFVPQAFLYGVLKYGVPSAGTIQPSIASARLAWIESDKWVTQIEILPNIFFYDNKERVFSVSAYNSEDNWETQQSRLS